MPLIVPPSMENNVFNDVQIRKNNNAKPLTEKQLAGRRQGYPAALIASFLVPLLGLFLLNIYPAEHFKSQRKWLKLGAVLCLLLWLGGVYLLASIATA